MKWIITLVVVVIIAIGGWLFRDAIGGMFGGSEPVVQEPIVEDPLADWSNFASSTWGVSLRYPPGYKVTSAFQNTSVSPTKPIMGASFTIPASVATGTNLSTDTYLSIEQLPRANKCTADIFLAANVVAREALDGGVTYSVATSSGAAAGNRYDELVWALPASKPCTAVRYYIHSTNLGNYATGTVREFDRVKLLQEFDQIRHTLTTQ
jgi:hypothetical protein